MKVNVKRMAVVATACFFATFGAAPIAHSAQPCGDVTNDGNLAASDALAVLKAAVGQPVDLICEADCQEVLPRVEALEALLAHVTIQGNNMVLTGMNFQVVSGSGATDGDINGAGNIIIGYNEADNKDKRTGSHNLVIGIKNSYTTYAGIVAGGNNEISGQAAVVLGGINNLGDGDYATISGGFNNQTKGDTSTIAGGESNRTEGISSAISGGLGNVATAQGATVNGGSGNIAAGGASTLGGGRNRSVVSLYDWQAGGLFQAE